MSSLPIDPGDPIWEDLRSPAERWRDEWARRAHQHPQAARQGFVFTHAQCYAAGYSRAQLRSQLRRRIWWSPRRGVVAVFDPGGDARIARALSATSAALVRPGSVVSHESAAILHGLPVFAEPEAPVVTAPGRQGSRDGVEVHLTALEQVERTNWYGVELTSVARTVVDIARRGGHGAGLVTGDAALRERLTTLSELATAVSSGAGRPGNIAARWVSENADPGGESALESLTRACLLRAHLPRPRLQVVIAGARARVDLLYPDQRLVVEADGMLKYTTPADLRDEKRRQERLERAGYRVIRVTYADVVGQPDETALRVRRALLE